MPIHTNIAGKSNAYYFACPDIFLLKCYPKMPPISDNIEMRYFEKIIFIAGEKGRLYTWSIELNHYIFCNCVKKRRLHFVFGSETRKQIWKKQRLLKVLAFSSNMPCVFVFHCVNGLYKVLVLYYASFGSWWQIKWLMPLSRVLNNPTLYVDFNQCIIMTRNLAKCAYLGS